MPRSATPANDTSGLARRNILRSCIAIVVVLVAFEAFLRLFVISPSQTVPDAQLGWAYRPNATILHATEGYARNTFNSLGLNDEEVSPSNGQRIVIALGDSYTIALQVPQAANFTSISEVLNPCLDVVNAGRPGATVIHYPVVLDRLQSATAFTDIVLVLTMGDIEEVRRSKFQITRDPGTKRLERIILSERGPSRLRRSLDPIFSNSSLATYIKDRLRHLEFGPSEGEETADSRSSPADDFAIIDEIFSYVFKNLKKRARTHVLYIPSFEYLPNRVSVESDASIKASATIYAAATRADIAFARVDGLAEAYRASGIPPNGFANNDIRRGHLNESGHLETARALVELLGPSCSPPSKSGFR